MSDDVDAEYDFPDIPNLKDLLPNFKVIMEQGVQLLRSMEARRPSKRKARRNASIREEAVEIGELARGVEYWIVENQIGLNIRRMRAQEAAGVLPPGFCASMRTMMTAEGALNGYVAFDKRHAPLIARDSGEDGILAYIPIHGGVTYACKDSCACVYGFDTLHFKSDFVPRTERPWIAWQCRVLYESLLVAAKIERTYLRAQTNEQKAAILKPLVDLIPEEDLGFSAMLNVLSRKL